MAARVPRRATRPPHHPEDRKILAASCAPLKPRKQHRTTVARRLVASRLDGPGSSTPVRDRVAVETVGSPARVRCAAGHRPPKNPTFCAQRPALCWLSFLTGLSTDQLAALFD